MIYDQGGESTFGTNYQFTKDLQALVAKELPKIDIRVLVYPKYETRGNLGEAVSRFREWYVLVRALAISSSFPLISSISLFTQRRNMASCN